ncbi:GntR family transcriptional regulator [Nonomuraea angiospora]|uniref:DNA-binding transcriptional regulator YhcF (GntR family) n=1 Tax=Nonomuraea angiospora TaxID=46172 RepID=A0ABR9MD53_9ACTN|nr:GntR family transcriptional regulator [Nonomuraea angiospora]MBE1590515.1 DNA-binding transcriptional regulator YhcF (GntR family) [Nonomuraea angiospora]
MSKAKVGPTYLRIAEDLRRRIREGDPPAGAMLPSEADLARGYGVARGTVRQAVAELERTGLVASEAGRGRRVMGDDPSGAGRAASTQYETDCFLPEEGWGLLTLEVTRPSSGKQWTDSGTVHDKRGLKQREEREVRPVPIPPELVRILRAHLEEFGTAPDGRLFRNERGGVLGASTYSRAWEEARRFALTPQQVTSPLAGKPYDLRHAALSTWLNAGVDATVVAERAGNSVEVLLKRYAKCLDGRDSQINRRIEAALEA